MKIYIMRHGEAPSAMDAGVGTDAERPLSPKGRADARRAAEYLAQRGGKPSVILASPLLRAQQTAAQAQRALEGKPKIVTYAPLDNRLSGVDLYRRLEADEPGTEILCIGHMPQVGELAHYLTGAFFQFMPAGQLAVDSEGPGRGRVLWHVNPGEW